MQFHRANKGEIYKWNGWLKYEGDVEPLYYSKFMVMKKIIKKNESIWRIKNFALG